MSGCPSVGGGGGGSLFEVAKASKKLVVEFKKGDSNFSVARVRRDGSQSNSTVCNGMHFDLDKGSNTVLLVPRSKVPVAPAYSCRSDNIN